MRHNPHQIFHVLKQIMSKMICLKDGNGSELDSMSFWTREIIFVVICS